jgi:hypothetical protein
MLNLNLIQRALTAIVIAAIVVTGAVVPVAAESAVPAATNNTNLTAPANDDFANAQSIGGGSGNILGSTASGTHETGEPGHAYNRGGASVWYKYVVPTSGVVTINTNNSNFDTLIAVYQGSSLSNLKLVGANDDANGFLSAVNFSANANDTFYIAVDGYYNSNSDSFASGSLTLNYLISNVGTNDNFANAQLLTGSAGKLITASNSGATREAGEPIIVGNAGGKSLWYKWVAPANPAPSYTFTFEGRLVSGNAYGTVLCGTYTGSALNNLTQVVQSFATGICEMTINPTAGQTYYLSVDGFFNSGNTQTLSITLNYAINRATKMADFDRDGRADITVFRPSNGTWYTINSIDDSLRIAQFGANGDIPVLGEVGYDGKPDYTAYRPSTGVWYVNDSATGFKAFAWGLAGDIPLLYHSEFYRWQTVYRPSTGWWYVYNGDNGYEYQWGQSGDRPAYGDIHGYGFDEMVVFRPSTGTWYINYGGLNFVSVKFGLNGDVPVMADYDGDGRSDIAVFRPSNGTWYILRSSDNSVLAAQWGLSGDIPQPADYDGDGKADIAVFRAGYWYIRQSSNNAFRQVQFGQAGDIPVTTPTS